MGVHAIVYLMLSLISATVLYAMRVPVRKPPPREPQEATAVTRETPVATKEQGADTP